MQGANHCPAKGAWSLALNGSFTPSYCSIRAAMNMLINTQWPALCQGLAPLHLSNLQIYSDFSSP